ncbi:MAG: hypothetical protein ACRDHX_13975, partial [Chloroflexota bacterium]
SIPATILNWKGIKSGFGLGKRTEAAPSFEAVINADAPRPADDAILGPRRTDARNPVRFSTRFRLRVAAGQYENQYIGPAEWWVSYGAYYATLTKDAASAIRLSFELGTIDNRLAQQPVCHGAFVYLNTHESLNNQPPYLSCRDESYEGPRSDCYYAKDSDTASLFWMVKLADPSLAFVGQPIHDGDLVFLENRALPSFKFWLPGRLIPSKGENSTYLSASNDAAYGQLDVGRWVVELVAES